MRWESFLSLGYDVAHTMRHFNGYFFELRVGTQASLFVEIYLLGTTDRLRNCALVTSDKDARKFFSARIL